MIIPDALLVAVVAVLAGVLGWLARGHMDMRARMAVFEARLERHGHDVERICAKLAEIATILTDLRLLVAKNTNTAGGDA